MCIQWRGKIDMEGEASRWKLSSFSRGGVKGEVERGWMRPRVFSPGSNRQKPLKRAENAVELMRRELVHQRYEEKEENFQ